MTEFDFRLAMPPKRRLSTSESTGGDENDGSAATKRNKLDEPGQMQAVLEFIKKFQKRSGSFYIFIFNLLKNDQFNITKKL